MGPKGIGKLYRRLAKNEMWHEGVVVVSLTNNSNRERDVMSTLFSQGVRERAQKCRNISNSNMKSQHKRFKKLN
ncbi:hypothetical protein YC2023_034714 [Brassica napus]